MAPAGRCRRNRYTLSIEEVEAQDRGESLTSASSTQRRVASHPLRSQYHYRETPQQESARRQAERPPPPSSKPDPEHIAALQRLEEERRKFRERSAGYRSFSEPALPPPTRESQASPAVSPRDIAAEGLSNAATHDSPQSLVKLQGEETSANVSAGTFAENNGPAASPESSSQDAVLFELRHGSQPAETVAESSFGPIGTPSRAFKPATGLGPSDLQRSTLAGESPVRPIFGANAFRNDSVQSIEESGLRVGRDDMATVPSRTSGDARRPNRYENRPPVNGSTLCRNGPQCRKFQEGGCPYNHDFGSMAPNGSNNSGMTQMKNSFNMLNLDGSKKSLNVDSPAFTPKPGNVQPTKMGISPKAASAAAFKPRGSGSVTPATMSHSKEPSVEFFPQQRYHAPQQHIQEFVPGQSSYVGSPQMETQQPQIQQLNTAYVDPFMPQTGLAGLDVTQTQMNIYTQQATSMAGPSFFQDPSAFKHPLNYHLYSGIGPRRENLLASQRSTSDFFIPDDLREDLQRKSEATLQTFANSTLPSTVEYFHSLVAIDTNVMSKGPSTFGYSSSVYKAVSSRDGHTYALRRIEGFRLTTEVAIRRAKDCWKRINSASLVQVHDAFTGKWFGDSSLIIVTDYHPNARTLAQKHFGVVGNNVHRTTPHAAQEDELWGYIVQLGNALKTIHQKGAAAQAVMASKVLVTSKNRVRLNGCAVFDVIDFEQQKSVVELQRADLQGLGRLLLDIVCRNPLAHESVDKAMQQASRSYSERLTSCIAWLLSGDGRANTLSGTDDYSVNALLQNISDKAIGVLDSTLHLEDTMTSQLAGELENGRLARLVMKLNMILERPDTGSTPIATTNPALLNQPSAAWSETGERYYLKLFRDYVFHQVDHDGRPVLDLGHTVTCLNKLDAGIDENVQLVSRDEQSSFICSYKEIKRGFETAWQELRKAQNPARR